MGTRLTSSIQLLRRAHLISFLLCIVLSVVALLGSAYMVATFMSGEVDGQSNATASCLSLLRLQGFNPQVRGNEISASRFTNDQIEDVVNQSGVIIAHCAGHKVVDYCAGEGCKTSGVSLTLTPR